MQDEIWIFDFDGTLVETDRKFVIDFNDIQFNIVETHKKTFKLYESLRDLDIPVSILTARHPIFIAQIEKITKTKKIYCRNYNLSLEEIEEVLKVESEDLKREFLEKMVQYKTEVLNNLSLHYKRVFFIDDYASEFKREGLLNENVFPILPFYIIDKGNTIDGAMEYNRRTGEIK